jgi:subtilase family serine protease
MDQQSQPNQEVVPEPAGSQAPTPANDPMLVSNQTTTTAPAEVQATKEPEAKEGPDQNKEEKKDSVPQVQKPIKNSSQHVRAAILATVAIVIILAILAVFAYMKKK